MRKTKIQFQIENRNPMVDAKNKIQFQIENRNPMIDAKNQNPRSKSQKSNFQNQGTGQ